MDKLKKTREKIAEGILDSVSYACRVGGTDQQLTLDMHFANDLNMSPDLIKDFFDRVANWESISPMPEEWAAVETIGDLVDLLVVYQTKKWFPDGMVIILDEPRVFFAYIDEYHFFTWLESIPAVISVVGLPSVLGKSAGLEVKLQNLDRTGLMDLIALTRRYGTSAKGLAALCIPQNESWFKDKEAHWYDEIFGA